MNASNQANSGMTRRTVLRCSAATLTGPCLKGALAPCQFELPRTEMYNEPFHVPEPDEVVLEERWEQGEWFRSGAIWTIGKGRVFYFRPGHETFAIYKENPVLQILENAVRWLPIR